MIAKNKQWNSWFRRIKRKIFLGSRQEEKHFTVPTPILDNSQEYALEDIELMGIPVVVHPMDDNWTPNQRPQPKQEALSNGTTH
ncbi:hypothetical protein [Vibrio jasicida]|uniref:hypothetical protein n=1 Tax=Vibrio jasicida TaxID=766224 RepID=UPI000CE533C1|nr:hypothetical protein [Vibrio jasicida]